MVENGPVVCEERFAKEKLLLASYNQLVELIYQLRITIDLDANVSSSSGNQKGEMLERRILELVATISTTLRNNGLSKFDSRGATLMTFLTPLYVMLEQLALKLRVIYLARQKPPGALQDIKTLLQALEDGFAAVEKKLAFDRVKIKPEEQGLTEVKLSAVPEAEKLFGLVRRGEYSVGTEEGKKRFCDDWREKVPHLPLPCLPENDDFWLLQKLETGNLFMDPQGRIPLRLSFGSAHLFLEEYYQGVGVLQRALEIENISSRLELHRALWEGDRDPKHSVAHKKILQKIFEDEWNKYEIGTISYDEALVFLSQEKIENSYGSKKVLHIDGYFKPNINASFVNGLITSSDGGTIARGSKKSDYFGLGSVRKAFDDEKDWNSHNVVLFLVIRKRRQITTVR